MSPVIGVVERVKLLSGVSDPVMCHRGHEVTDMATGSSGVLTDVLVWERDGRQEVQVFLRRDGREWDTEPRHITCACGAKEAE